VRRVLLVQLASAACAVALLGLAPIRGPAQRVDTTSAMVVGAAGGAVAFVALARPRRFARPPSPLLALASAAAASEEIVWRWGVVAGTLPLIGPAGALVVGTVGFAFGHVPLRAVQRLPPYLAVGATFGVIFLATGRLVAAIAAHCAYNALVLTQQRT
jgi:membrane protease YdiL (CAAX protease family)